MTDGDTDLRPKRATLAARGTVTLSHMKVGAMMETSRFQKAYGSTRWTYAWPVVSIVTVGQRDHGALTNVEWLGS